MRERAARAYFGGSRGLGALLRAGRYAAAELVERDGEPRVRKRRLWYAPMLVWLGGPLVRVLGTGVRVLPQRAWASRERSLYARVHGAAATVDDDGTLLLPRLPGETLAALLEDRGMGDAMRMRAINSAAAALADLHRAGITHGDAMAENVMIDVDAGAARWFDFETVHDPRLPLPVRRADDVRALLATTLLRTAPAARAATLDRLLDAYGDEEVVRPVAASFASVWRRPLAFHLGQAPLTFDGFREIGRLLRARLGPAPRDGAE